MRRTTSVPSGVHYLTLAGVLGVLVYAHAGALRGMVALWDRSPMYSFGYIVPVVSAFLLWTRREALSRLMPKPALRIAVPILSVALGLLVGGHLAGVQIAQQLAFVVALVGVAFLLFGTQIVRQTWVAFAYLLLMVPFWDALTEPLHLPFQKLSATLGIQMLQSVGVPASRDGVLVYLPNITFEVARACSGINYVVAVLALGIPLAYLYLPTFLRRLVLIASAVVIAAVSNGLRVALIGFLSYWDVGSPLHGPFHVLHGLFVSGIGYVVLFAGLRLLAPRAVVPAGSAGSLPNSRQSDASAAPPWRAFSLGWAGLTIVLFLLVGAIPMKYASDPVRLSRPLHELPSRLGAWTLVGSVVPETTWSAGADAQLQRQYAAENMPLADVSIAYFAFQRQDKEMVSHRGDALHRAATVVPMRLDDRGQSASVNVLRLSVKGRNRLGVFWYEIDGRVLSSKYEAKWLTLWNAVVHGRSNGMFVVVLADRPSAGDEAAIRDRMLEFAARLHAGLSTVTGRQP